jgi:hypothetical protein
VVTGEGFAMKRRFLRRLTAVCLALCVVVLAFGLTVRLLALIPGLTEENVRRIHIGMSAREVAAILGEPPDDGQIVELHHPPDDTTQRVAQRWESLLSAGIDMKDFQEQMTLRQVLGLLHEKLRGKAQGGHVPPFSVDIDAFQTENPDAPDVEETPVKFPPFLRKMSVATALRIALSKVPTNNATYQIRRDFIEVTTVEKLARGVVTLDGLIIPREGSRWDLWVKYGKARAWSWSDERRMVVVDFDDNREVLGISRTVLPPGEGGPRFGVLPAGPGAGF